jgi:hypothetical protein
MEVGAHTVTARAVGLVCTAALVALSVGSCRCGGTTEPAAAPSAPKGPPFEEGVLASFKAAGFSHGAFRPAPAATYGATRCVRGPIDRLDVLLCQYSNADAAKAAEKQLRGFVGGAVTGAARTTGDMSIAVADREKADIPGKRANRLLRVFSGQPPEALPPQLPHETKK